jgi:hypothetical protein
MSGIDFESLLSVTDGDCWYAGYIASLMQSRNFTQEQATRIYNTHSEAVEKYQVSFNEGNGKAVLSAIHYCMRMDYPMPGWLVEAWGNAYIQWDIGDAQTIDAALGIKRTHFKAIQKESLAPLIDQYIRNRRRNEGKESVPIGDLLFEDAAKYISEMFPELHMEKTKASELYYSLPENKAGKIK